MKTNRKIYVSLALAAVLWACDQNGLAVGSAVKNLVTAPISGLKALGNAISGNTYSNYSKETDELRAEVPNSCADRQEPEQGIFAKIRDTMRGVRDQACTCRPWGTCPPSNCDCKALCPDSFDIFSIHKDRNQGDQEHELAFSNTPGAFKNHAMTQGYCWGHASITAKFNRLGFFDPSKKPRAPQSSPEWREFYKKVIDSIASNEVTDIPGFENLYEFSQHPTIQELLADRVASEWADKAMNVSALGIAMDSGQMAPDAASALVKDLKKRVSLYQSPQIVFTMRDRKFATHATLISEVQDVGRGVSRICLRDNNNSAGSRGGCHNYLEVRPSGEIRSSMYGQIGGVAVGGNENADTIEQLKSLRGRCKKIKGCS